MYTTSLVKEAGLQMKYIPLTPKNALNLCDWFLLVIHAIPDWNPVGP